MCDKMDYRKKIREQIKFINCHLSGTIHDPYLDENIILELRPELFIYDTRTFYKKIYERLFNMAGRIQFSSGKTWRALKEVLGKKIGCPYLVDAMVSNIFKMGHRNYKETLLIMNDEINEDDDYKFKIKYHELCTIRNLSLQVQYNSNILPSSSEIPNTTNINYYGYLIGDKGFLERYDYDICNIRPLITECNARKKRMGINDDDDEYEPVNIFN